MRKFSTVFHLVGEQPIPVFLGALAVKADKQILLATAKTHPVAKNIANELGAMGKRVEVRANISDPYSMSTLHDIYREHLGNAPAGEIGFNATGGTKPMFAAVFTMLMHHNRGEDIFPFYIETNAHKLIWLKGKMETANLEPCLTVKNFIHLAGYKLKSSGATPENSDITKRANLTNLFWKERDIVRRNIQEFANATDRKYIDNKIPPAIYNIALKEHEELIKNKPKLANAWQKYISKELRWQNIANYVSGGWFEEYCLLKIAQHKKEHNIKEIYLGLSPNWAANINQNDKAQEFDVCYTDGFKFTIIECKAGKTRQEHIQKLENIKTTFGGAFGQAALVTINNPFKEISMRIEYGRKLTLFAGEKGINFLVEMLGEFRTGEIFCSAHTKKRKKTRTHKKNI